MKVQTTLTLAAGIAVLAACGETPTTPRLLDSSLVTSADRTVKMVPFTSTNSNAPVDNSAVVCPAGTAIKLRNLIAGTGNHLGQFTGEVIGCLAPTGVYSSLSNNFVAANGDELWTEMDPSNPARIIVFTPVPGTLLVTVGGFNIVGGTGRFDGASGSLTFQSDALFGVPGSAVTTIMGEISSPGSIKWATP